MRTYLVNHPGLKNSSGDAVPFQQYAGTQSDAAKIKNQVWDQHRDSGIKRSEIVIDEVEIPTDKKGLISWINDKIA